MVIAWLLFPLVLLAGCVGCGLAVERASGCCLPGPILPSVGLAVVIVVASLTTDSSVTARFTTALIVLLALIGLATSRSRIRRTRLDGWALAVAIGVFAVCAAPVVLTGNATFLGYFVLNDGVFHFSLATQLLSHGHDLTRLPASSYLALVHGYISTAYPVGADVALGAIRPLVGQDVAWLFQPFQAVVMALGALAVFELLRSVVRSPALRAMSAFVAAQAGLVYAYYLEGSIKEVTATWLITLTVVMVFKTLRSPLRLRGLIPLIIGCVAGVDVLGLAILPWLAPPLAVFFVALAFRGRRVSGGLSPQSLALTGVGGLLLAGALTAPILVKAASSLQLDTAVLTQQGDLGNLVSPLPTWQIFGIWPVGDFRFPVVAHYRLAYALIGIAVASAILGSLWALRKRRWEPLLLVAGNGIAAAYLLTRASPYAGGKVMMIASLTAVVAAMLGPGSLHASGKRVEAWILALAIAFGVLWTNALGYHDASVAPRDRLNDLASIGRRFTQQGPTFYNLSDEYAAYFLRAEAPVVPALSPPLARRGISPPSGREPWDPDDLDPGYVQRFRLLVLARSPLTSRPPADFRLAKQDHFYNVWQRTPTPRILAHIPLGGALYPESVPRCSLVRATAADAIRLHARLAYAATSPVPTLIPTRAEHPPDWGLVASDPFSLIPRGKPGAVIGTVRVQHRARYRVLAEGSVSQRLNVFVDGHKVGSVTYELGPPGQVVPVGEVPLGVGTHQIEVIRPANNLTPGDGGTGRTIGPVMFVPDRTSVTVSELAPGLGVSLCGRSLDWLEIVR